MSKKNASLDEPNEGASAARKGPQAPAFDPASETLNGYPPPPVAGPPGDTHPVAGDPTYIQAEPGGGRSMVPSGPPPVLAAEADAEQTLAATPTDATLAGVDPATQAYHQAAIKGAP